MYKIENLPTALLLGNQGENLVTAVQIDCAAWLADYPGATMAATIILPGYGDPAPLPVEMDGAIMTIKVTRAMTQASGRGSINLRLLGAGDEEKRSTVVETYVKASHPLAEGVMPDPVQDWIDDATNKMSEFSTFEQTASDNESARQTSETARKTAETGRANAEQGRVSAETARVNAENARTSAETARANAETARASAEAQRQTDTATAITNAQTAATTANAAAAGIDAKIGNSQHWRQAAGNPAQVYPVPESLMYPVITITPTQSGSGDPSPDNIRPIVGVGNVNILHTGKNLLPRMTAAQYQSVGITATRNDDGSLTLDGTATSIAYIKINQEPEANIYLNPGTYVQSLAGAVSGVSIITKLANPPGTIIVSGQNNFTVTKRTEALFTYLYVSSGTTLNNLRVYPQIEIGSTATPYEPYIGASHAIALPETLYGGLVDLETGVVRREWAVKAFDGTEAWSTGTIQSNGAFGTSLAISDMTNGTSMDFACSHLKTGAYSDNADANTVAFGTINNNYISVAVIANNVAEFKSWLAAQHTAGTPVTICYRLATPIETPIDPLTLTTLQQLDRYTPRQNVVSVSAGALALGYAKSPIQESNEIWAALHL